MQQINREFYEKYGLEWYSTERRQWERTATSYKVSSLCALLQELRPKRILDFGCGLGDALDLLATKFQVTEAIGVDISSTMIEYAKRQFPKYRFIQGGIESLKNIQVDLLTFFDVLEHISDIPATLEAAKQSATYIGIGIPLEKTWPISLLNRFHLKEKKSRLYYSEGHLYEFNRSEVDTTLKGAGLQILEANISPPPKELQFSRYMRNRMRAKAGYIATTKYFCYIALSKCPYAIARPLLELGAGTNYYLLCKS